MTRSSPITEERIRERAYLLWLEEGQPEGKHAEHWERARELLALEPVEEAVILENRGEFPTMTDQGEQEVPKKRKPTASKRRPKIAKPTPGARPRPM